MLALLSEMQLVSIGGLWWEIRNPLRWWGYFFAGWVVSEQRPRVARLPIRHRRLAGLMLLAAAGGIYGGYACCLPPGWSSHAAAMQYAMIYGLLLGTALVAWDASGRPLVRWLSEASYPIYLYHFFIVMLMRQFAAGLSDLAVFGVASVTTAIGVAGMRWACGPRARLIIG